MKCYLIKKDGILSEVQSLKYEKYGVLVSKFNDNQENINTIIDEADKEVVKILITVINNKQVLRHYKEKSYERINDFEVNKIIKL